MKKLKSIIVYLVIILLCIGALVGYIIKNSKPEAPTSSVNKASTTIAENTKAAATNEKTAEITEETTPYITDGSNITGKSEGERNKHVEEVMAKALASIEPSPIVGIGRGEDHAKATAEALQNAGGLKDLVKKGDVVLIKPNVCTEQYPGFSIITDYRIVQEVANEASELGASRVIVAEGGFYGNSFSYKNNKYEMLKGVELFNFNDCEEKDCYELKPKKSLVGKGIFIPKIYMDADVVINIAKLKTHFITGVSLSLKNCIGIPSEKIYGGSGDKYGLHTLGLEEAIIDLNRIRKPDLSIIDGVEGGEGNGPSTNTPVKSNIVFAGKDLVALDTVALNFMGFKLKWITHIERAAKEKLGVSDLNKIKLVGGDLNSIKMDFKSNEKDMFKALEDNGEKE